jgi:C1A family cysteine protease
MRIVMRKQGFSDIRPSRLFIYYNERLEQGDVDHDTGSDIRTSMRVVAKYGAPSEDQWEYNVGNWREKPPEHTYQQGVDDMVHIYFAIDQNLNDLKMCLVHGFPFNFGFSVYSSFEGDEVAKTGIVQLPTRWESQEGGHAVCCVGYDDQINSFIVQNSWGADWGDHGFFYLPYGYMINPGLAADFWTIRSLESRGDPTRKWIVP